MRAMAHRWTEWAPKKKEEVQKHLERAVTWIKDHRREVQDTGGGSDRRMGMHGPRRSERGSKVGREFGW